MDAMYRAAMDAPSRVVLSESARRRKDRASAARARSKGYSAGGGLTSTLLDRWWSEATGAPARRLPGRPHETPPTTMRGDQAVAFFNRTGLPTGAPSPHPAPPRRPRDSLTRETSPPRLPPKPFPEVLVTVWELAKLDRRGAPTGLLKPEFEAACCLVSLALFENLAALDRRALDARNASTPALRDPRLRKRLGYATRGMYWKFQAFDVSTMTNANADASANDANDRGWRGDEHVGAIGTSSTTAPAATASEPSRVEPSRVEPSTSARAASPPPQSAPPLPPPPPRAPLFAPMSLASTIAWRTPAAGAAMAADAAGLFDGFERTSLGADVAATDSTARSPFTVDDRATRDAAGSASRDWNAGDDLRPSGSVEFGSMDFSGERFEVPTNPTTTSTTTPNPNANANANATTVSTSTSTSTSTTTARVRPARLQEVEEWSSATRTWPWLAAAAAGASIVSSDSAATLRFPSGAAGEAREEEREAATNSATPGDWEAFTRSI